MLILGSVAGDELPFVEVLLAAPAGVALLARLEAEHRPDVAWFASPVDSDAEAVRRAARAVATMSFGRLVALAAEAAEALAGPWVPDAPESLAAAYRQVGARRSIAEAVAERFGHRLSAPIDLEGQQWWHTDNARYDGFDGIGGFRDFDRVYGNGELTWAGLRTVTDPPPETHEILCVAWEMFDGPISRWRLPVWPDARVWEIHRPSDWVALVETYPQPAPGPHAGWELAGPNQDVADVADLLAVPGQHAVRAQIVGHVLPDWAAVASDYDGVHLSWAGFLTTEGYVGDLYGGGVTMLRYWSSERTLWLADVFGTPAPLGRPELPGSISGVDVRGDDARRAQDLDVLTGLLGR